MVMREIEREGKALETIFFVVVAQESTFFRTLETSKK